MALLPYTLARWFLFSQDPETAHELTLHLLNKTQGTPLARAWANPRIADPVTLAGLHFPNRVGLAAGLDKNAQCIDAFEQMGFGFVEAGTVTPLAQPGNPRPRLFRLPAAQALINRMGFNNDGLQAFVQHVDSSHFHSGYRSICGLKPRNDPQNPAPAAPLPSRMLLGLNIGKNAATPIEQATDDYLRAFSGVYTRADYVAVNISSPNTQNLRELQNDAALHALLAALTGRQRELADEHGRRVPLFLKIAPDLHPVQVQAIAEALLRHGIDGVIATNTTVAREAVRGLPHADEAGGLSGVPLREASNRVIAQLRAALGPGYPIIGVGGIFSGADAIAKIQAGADLVQIYSGLIYRGPALVAECARALAAARPRP